MAEYPKEVAKKLYEMGLHSDYNLDDRTNVLRVPGGWVYRWNRSTGAATTFVPFDNEFHPGESKSGGDVAAGHVDIM